MATTSFDKDFTLKTKKAVKSFEKIISTPTKSIEIYRELISSERKKTSEQKLKQILRQYK